MGRKRFELAGAAAVVLSCILMGKVAQRSYAVEIAAVEQRIFPKGIDFGRVRTGAVVQGNTSFAFDGETVDGLAVQISPPDFVNVRFSRLNLYPSTGNGQPRVSLLVNYELNTAVVGSRDVDLVVVVGSERASVPIRVEVAEPSPVRNRVLIIEPNWYRWKDVWSRMVAENDLDPDYLSTPGGSWIRNRDLSPYRVIVLDGSDLVNLHKSDAAAAIAYAEKGGRVVVCAQRAVRETVSGANDILQAAGLRMDDVESDGARTYQLGGDRLSPHPLLKDVATLQLFRASPISVTDSLRGQLLVGAPDFENQGYAAIGRIGEGDVVAIGQSGWNSWIEMPYEPLKSRHELPEDCDNARFFENVITLRDR